MQLICCIRSQGQIYREGGRALNYQIMDILTVIIHYIMINYIIIII